MTTGFPEAEYVARTKAAQARMAEEGLFALLLTTEPEVRYYTGFLTRFWESPTRPWFVIIPVAGKPIAVIPSIGAHLMGETWVEDIRTWQSPDYNDDGISLLADTLREITASSDAIGIADRFESHARMPVSDLRRLSETLERSLIGDAGITQTLRQVKSEAEIAKIAQAAKIAGRAFDRVGEIARVGLPLSDVFRRFQMLCLEEGADYVPYLAGAAGQSGYVDVISPARDTLLAKGDVLMLDTGLVRDGYFCDFDRNFSFGLPDEALQSDHSRLIDATTAGFEAAKPGALVSDLFHAMNAVANPGAGQMGAGRLGHGLGMQLTEGVSIIPADQTELQAGMVLTLEPTVETREGRIMVHEENIVIRATGAEYLSTPQPHAMRVLP